jgi:arylsulfatase A-like enzyme
LTRVLIPRENFGISESELTLPEVLKGKGYHTACVGKWHLGDRLRHRPTRHGFDHFFGLLYSHDMTLPVVHWPRLKLFRGEKPVSRLFHIADLTKRLTEEAVEVIDRQKDTPFFLYLPYTAPHTPLAAGREFAGRSRHGSYGDVVEELDWSVGEILKKIREENLEENTIVIFCSDNGPARAASRPAGNTGGLRGGKGTAWEGGVRVPCVLRWPGRIPGNITRPGMASLMDLFPTLTLAAGAELPTNHVLDGVDLTGFLRDETPSPRIRVCHFWKSEVLAIRAGPWKLHLRRGAVGQRSRRLAPPELYDLDSDRAETRNVAAEHPEIVTELTTLSASVRGSIEAGRLAPSHIRSLLPGKKAGRKWTPGNRP